MLLVWPNDCARSGIWISRSASALLRELRFASAPIHKPRSTAPLCVFPASQAESREPPSELELSSSSCMECLPCYNYLAREKFRIGLEWVVGVFKRLHWCMDDYHGAGPAHARIWP